MENIQKILSEIEVIRIRNEAIIDATGGRFNMFRIVGVNHYENTHSGIIAEFLNPKGSHGLKDKFLREFINQTIPKDFSFNCNEAQVYTEFTLNNLGRADIVIEQKDKHKAIIIENKIYAEDQYEQLKRYNQYALGKYGEGNYLILYLTLEGVDASEDSGSGVEYTRISYSMDVIKWLEECAKISLHFPMVRETINQYINHLKQLTNQDMDAKSQKEIVDIISRKENIPNVAKILDNQDAWRQEIIIQYLQPALEKLAKDKKLKFDGSNLDKLFERNKYFSFYCEEWGRFRIYFGSDTIGYKNFYVGISFSEGNKVNNIQEQLNCFKDKGNAWWPYGSSFLDKYMWNNDTFVDISKGDESKLIKEIGSWLDAIISEIKEKKIDFKDCDKTK
ncbi:MAG: PD-(D/E)XK nuclease family protein [Bacteroidales bacterium]|nr:PD-(D/E)XK nuclease family protein [Bacteroidales bacterium]